MHFTMFREFKPTTKLVPMYILFFYYLHLCIIKKYHRMKPDRIVYAIISVIMVCIIFNFFYKKITAYDKQNANIILFFGFNERVLNEKNKKIIRQYFSTHDKTYDKICIIGHTDSIDSIDTNKDASHSELLQSRQAFRRFGYVRAIDTLQFINQNKVTANEYRVVSSDYSDPMHKSHHHLNRRVEIHLS